MSCQSTPGVWPALHAGEFTGFRKNAKSQKQQLGRSSMAKSLC
ncbi:unnamed protein product, partial [Staurois parvus]